MFFETKRMVLCGAKRFSLQGDVTAEESRILYFIVIDR